MLIVYGFLPEINVYVFDTNSLSLRSCLLSRDCTVHKCHQCLLIITFCSSDR